MSFVFKLPKVLWEIISEYDNEPELIFEVLQKLYPDEKDLRTSLEAFLLKRFNKETKDWFINSQQKENNLKKNFLSLFKFAKYEEEKKKYKKELEKYGFHAQFLYKKLLEYDANISPELAFNTVNNLFYISDTKDADEMLKRLYETEDVFLYNNLLIDDSKIINSNISELISEYASSAFFINIIRPLETDLKRIYNDFQIFGQGSLYRYYMDGNEDNLINFALETQDDNFIKSVADYLEKVKTDVWEDDVPDNVEEFIKIFK